MIRRFLIIAIILLDFNIDTFSQTVIKMKRDGGISIIPCKVNGLKLNFIFDTGASDVSLSMTEATFMLKNEYLSVNDIIGSNKFTDATGNINEGVIVNINEIEIAGLKLYNVKATIVKNDNAPILLGQSAIGKLGKIQLDLEQNTLTILSHNDIYDFLSDNQKSQKPTNIQPQKLINSVIGNSIKIGDLEVAEYDFSIQMNWEDAEAACISLGNDWRLPTNEELKIIVQNQYKIGNLKKGGFWYWSSTEDDLKTGWKTIFEPSAWARSFPSGANAYNPKTNRDFVRAVRKKSEQSTDNQLQQSNHPVIGNSIKIRNLEVAEHDFSYRMGFNNAKFACASLGNGWRLPTKDELNYLYQNRSKISGFANDLYWSSEEASFTNSWVQDFSFGSQKVYLKNITFYVRAIRTF